MKHKDSKVEEQKVEEQELFEVMLLKDHKHAGELKRASTTIKVNRAERDWMRAQHIIAAE
jgi:hypothetical protein